MNCAVTETMRFGPLDIDFGGHVIRPRPWTIAQSMWAAELVADAPDGPVLELCAGVGHIGLVLASLVSRDLVLVDANPRACVYARTNAAAAGLVEHVDVRNGPMDGVIAPEEQFAIILADPPWVRSSDVAQFPDDPLTAIDGGPDGLALARVCVDLIGDHLAAAGVAILQLGDADQVAAMRSHLDSRPDIGLCVTDVRVPGGNGILVRLSQREPPSPPAEGVAVPRLCGSVE